MERGEVETPDEGYVVSNSDLSPEVWPLTSGLPPQNTSPQSNHGENHQAIPKGHSTKCKARMPQNCQDREQGKSEKPSRPRVA